MPRTTIRSEDITDLQVKTADIANSEVTTTKMATDPTNASNLSSGSVPLAQLGNVDTSGIDSNKEDIALLAFKTQANGSLARYNLVDQSVDAFEDASGINAPASSDDNRDATGKYYSGRAGGVGSTTGFLPTGAGTWTCPAGIITAEVLIVAGGGRGGKNHGGGGGGGGIVYAAAYPTVAGVVYDLTVGAGYTANRGGNVGAGNGSNSTFNDNDEGSQSKMTANGGGSGGGASYSQGSNGGSGGGPGGHSAPDPAGGFTSTQPASPAGGGIGYGGDGGAQVTNSMGTGAGGGGAAGDGGDVAPNGSPGGPGGVGRLFSTFVAYGTNSSNVASSGSDGGYFGGGGGGGRSLNAPGLSGPGGVGGGAAGATVDGGQGSDAIAACGGGGGGGANNDGNGGYGGSGFVGISYATPFTYANMTLESNTITAETAPTKADLVFTYTNGAGTAVLGTNITAEVSMDGGTTFTNFAIAAGDVQGTTGGHTIVTKNNLTLTSTSGTNMRYRIKTLVQSASIDTRIHAVSLGWS